MLIKTLCKSNVKEIILLLEKNGETHFGEIENTLQINRGNLSKVLNLLVAEKFINKREEESNLKLNKTYYSLTELGKNAILVYELNEKLKEIQKEL
ncbi:transcriptional regulator [Methanococcus maripaludis]|uniref:DNA-binding HxlR family transcriptional regulator n=1 Tax=Methanococcus maripaludis TaxID=39152 RepID=A0A7J9S5F9_METMI|nr:transcriptional regulator [Methanococcus maripaludis]MBB6067922.1 DNA-binding HxlR family transcriptional regulator [Methanococcus maripaludis]